MEFGGLPKSSSFPGKRGLCSLFSRGICTRIFDFRRKLSMSCATTGCGGAGAGGNGFGSISGQPFIQLHPSDQVVVVTQPIAKGTVLSVNGQAVKVRTEIPAGHKLAIQEIAVDRPVFKYGWAIGLASEPISPGDHVHSHNLRCDHQVDLEALATEIPPPPAPRVGETFQGYVRADGRVGTRNYLAIISSVNCSASVARHIADRFRDDALSPYGNIDGVVALKHEGGCAMAFDGLKHQMLNRVLGGYAKHPNIGGYLLVGLGCEQGSLGHLMSSQRLTPLRLPDGTVVGQPTGGIPILSMQDEGGTRKTIERGVEMVAKLLPQVNDVRRQSVSASHLMVGLECGGSDGYSGVTANPAVGACADRIVAAGGTAILSETTEIYGAEHLLTRRSRSPEVAQKLLALIDWWKWYCGIFGQQFDNNPSVGNKAGGLTTIEEKSLGAVAKGGSTVLEDVFAYAEPVTSKGFVVMDSPGYDPASVAGMVAGGANVVLFTTGRGSCFGCKPVPSLKIASNSYLYHRMTEDMDINAGEVLEGKTVDQMGEEMFQRVLEVASGSLTKSELLGLGDDEFVPWTVGPTL
jgi:altronate hydrolase